MAHSPCDSHERNKKTIVYSYKNMEKKNAFYPLTTTEAKFGVGSWSSNGETIMDYQYYYILLFF